jgi:hypothetical protein
MGVALALITLAIAAPTSAQEIPRELTLPWTDVAPAIDAEVVRAAAVGSPDARIGRFEPRRASARHSGRLRAIAAIHAWADDALARVRADPRIAQAVHTAIDASARVEGVRPLVDGGAVVVVTVPLEALRTACRVRGVPWAR